MIQETQTHRLLDQAEELASALPELMVKADRLAATIHHGSHGRRRSGMGDDFWQYRPYQTGDVMGRIDWKQSAKSDHLYVKENEWQISQTVYLWFDRTASMNFTSDKDQEKKVDRARLLTVALARLLTDGGERVCLLGAPMRPGSNQHSWEQIAKYALEPNKVRFEDLPQISYFPRQSNLVVLSDFLSPTDQVISVIRQLAPQINKGHFLQILDPVEETFPYEGRVLFKGLEGEASFLAPKSEDMKQAYQNKMALHRDSLQSYCKRHHWDFNITHTDQTARKSLTNLYYGLVQ